MPLPSVVVAAAAASFVRFSGSLSALSVCRYSEIARLLIVVVVLFVVVAIASIDFTLKSRMRKVLWQLCRRN